MREALGFITAQTVRSPLRLAALAALFYAALSAGWVLLSDALFDPEATGPWPRERWHVLQGLLFTAVSGAMLFAAVFLLLRHLRRASERNRLLEELVEHSADTIYAKDLDGRYVLYNAEAARSIGRPAASVIGLRDADLFPTDQAAQIGANDQQVLRQDRPKTFEEVIDTTAGPRTFLATKGPLHQGGRVAGMYGISRDITAMVESRRALERAEERYRRLFKDNPAPMWVIDNETLRYLAVNHAAEQQYGWTRAEFLRMTPLDIRVGAGRAALEQLLLGAPTGMPPDPLKPVYSGRWVHRRKDGSEFEVDVDGRPIEYEGRPAQLVMALDISERAAAEEQLQTLYERLRLSEQRFRLAAEGGHVWDWGLVAGRTDTAQAFWDLLEVPAPPTHKSAEGLGALMHPDDRPRWRAALRAHLRHHEPYRLDFRLRDGQGQWRWFHTQGQAMWNEQGRAIYMAGTTFEITAQWQAEQALVASQRELSELTQRLLSQEQATTRALALALHDGIGQLLAGSRLHLDLARAEAPELAPLERAATLQAQAIDAVRELLGQLRPPLATLGLASSLENELESGPAHGLGLALHFEADALVREQRWPDDVEYAALMVCREAVANVLRHAEAARLDVLLDGDADHLSLVVRDDGRGLPDEALAGRPGHLGLVGMRERAMGIGGRLSVRRRPQKGTEVRLSWQRATAETTP